MQDLEKASWFALATRPRVAYTNKFDFSVAGSEELSIPTIVIELMTRTKRLYRWWWAAHYTIGLTGVFAGAVLTALTSSTVGGPGEVDTLLATLRPYSWLIGIVAAVTTSLVTFLGPLHKAERYWSAYHHLEQACLEYRGTDTDPRMRKLMKRVMQARKILQVVEPDEKVAPFGPAVDEGAASPGTPPAPGRSG